MTWKSILIATFAALQVHAAELPKQVFLPTTPFRSSHPYITGETFREFSDHVFDPTVTLDPYKVRCGDTIFVIWDYLDYFFQELHPLIPEPYILITHHFFGESDSPYPGPDLAFYLDDEKLLGWFTHNVDREHPKLHPLPLGIGSPINPFGNKETFDAFLETHKGWPAQKDQVLYLNFSLHTYPGRSAVYNIFKGKPFCTDYIAANKKNLPYFKDLWEYLMDVRRHKFVLSPRGNGLDCFRTWEALLAGSYPVVLTSTLDPLFENLPVVIVKDWNEVTEAFLEKKYEELSHPDQNYEWEKIYIPYWFNKINSLREQARQEWTAKS
jgi:hypothetical protein